MNRNIKIGIGIVLTLAIAYFIISRKPWANLKGEKRDFAVKDTALITKIFIADKEGNHVLLEKKDNGDWMVDQTQPADLQKVNLVKATLYEVQVMHPVPASEFNAIVALMANNATKVELYQGKDLIKTIYVGESTPDGTGTYMMLEGSSTPFVTHIPGFIGYLSPRFNSHPIKWRSKLVFGYEAAQIQEVTIRYPETNSSINILNKPEPELTIDGKQVEGDQQFIKYYLSSFNNLYLEGYDEDIPQQEVDSIRKITPYCVIELKPITGSIKKLTVIKKAIDQRTKERYDEKGNLLSYDHDKYFAFVDDEKEMAYVQQYNFGKLFKTGSDFKR